MEQLKLTPEEAGRLTPDMLEHRKASFILSEYVVLKGQQYVLEISAKEAMAAYLLKSCSHCITWTLSDAHITT